MKAAVCYEFGKPLIVEEIDIDPPQKGEVKVRLVATSICHSDIHLITGDWGGKVPVVAGHEAAGVVEQVGENVTLAKPGDEVVVSLLSSCGRCFYCTTGSPYHCEARFALDTESRLRNKDGKPLQQGLRMGAFAEYVVVDQSQVVQIPKEMPMDRAAPLACGVITGVGAVVNTAQVRPGDSAVVIGTGGVGLNAIQGAVLVGAYPIIAVDILDNKLEAARAFGATATINSRQENAIEKVMELTSGRGVAYVFVTVGNATAVVDGFQMLRKGGAVVIVGLPQAGASVSIAVGQFIMSGRRIMGCKMGSTRLSVDIPWLVALYQEGRLKLDELITAHYPLQEINEAIAAVVRGEALRNVIMF